MLVQDVLTGQLQDIPEYGMAPAPAPGWPDPQVYGLGEVHGERGNSLGVFFLPKLIRGGASAVSRLVPRAVQGGLLPLPLSPWTGLPSAAASPYGSSPSSPGWPAGGFMRAAAPPMGDPFGDPSRSWRRGRGGSLHAAPGFSEYDMGEVVYDGLGNPVALVPPGLAFDDGFGHPLGLPFLAPFLPAIVGAAKAVLPRVTRALPGLIARLAPPPAVVPMPAVAAPAPPGPAVVPAPPALPPAVPGPGLPGSGYPMWAGRFRRRRPHAR